MFSSSINKTILLNLLFYFQMSFSGRLGSSSSANVDSVVPLSISSTSSWDLLWTHDSISSTKNESMKSDSMKNVSMKSNVDNPSNFRRPRPTHQAGLAEELVRSKSK